jgi:superoxide dismutase, Fe-Mn family
MSTDATRIDPVEEAGLESFPASDAPAWPGPDPAPPLLLPNLPYEYSALEPIIDSETMKLHHGKHHRAYVDGLNAALAKHREWRGPSLESLLRDRTALPADVRAAVHNLGGGHYNHSLFWDSMTPHGAAPDPGFQRSLEAAFGSFDRFRESFEVAGSKQFGSGWVYLVANPARGFALEILTLPNQDTPLDAGRVALLACDVWEHAYYLKYRNRRADWLKAWWDVVDWRGAAERLAAATRS